MPSRSRTLILATLLALAAVPTGAVEFLGAFEWTRETREHGGYSGLEVSDDGQHFTAISDRSRIVTGGLLRSGGAIVGITELRENALRTRKGPPLRGEFGDSEGLVVVGSGFFVSFEASPRVWFYTAPDAAARRLPRHPDFRRLPKNSALEGLAMDGAGRLFTVPERPMAGRGFPVWRFDGGQWTQAFTLPDSGYAIVGADFDDRGRLYLLERKFLVVGFASRLSRIAFEGDQPVSAEVLLETPLGVHDNLEGVSIWRDARGTLRATMISDDNFNWFQRTEFVEYALPD